MLKELSHSLAHWLVPCAVGLLAINVGFALARLRGLVGFVEHDWVLKKNILTEETLMRHGWGLEIFFWSFILCLLTLGAALGWGLRGWWGD